MKYYQTNLKLDNVTAVMLTIIACMAVGVIVLMTMMTVSIPITIHMRVAMTGLMSIIMTVSSQ